MAAPNLEEKFAAALQALEEVIEDAIHAAPEHERELSTWLDAAQEDANDIQDILYDIEHPEAPTRY